ncbi:MAG: RidA family protein [Defluviitaleaceae bacterium]|nr:RidA family protein [Defluviitaleaceae bacterium]
MNIQTISTDKAPAAIGPFSQAKVHNGVIYVSGQLPIDPTTGEMELGDIKKQAQMVMTNVAAIVEAAGSSMDNILKATVLLTDMADFAQVNEVYASFFTGAPPARICYQVSALPKGASVEVDAICAV